MRICTICSFYPAAAGESICDGCFRTMPGWDLVDHDDEDGAPRRAAQPCEPAKPAANADWGTELCLVVTKPMKYRGSRFDRLFSADRN
jgi:hypothetical protein